MHRALFLTETYPPDRGGMSESCDRIVRGLRAGGVAIDLIHFDRRATRASYRETGSGSELRFPLETDPAHTINCLWNKVQQVIDCERVTHVVAFGGSLPLLAAPVFAAWMARPLVTLLRGNEFDAGLFDPRRRAILDDALRRSEAICTVTTDQAEKVAALYKGAAPHVVPNGIDLEAWSVTEADHARGQAWRAANVEPGRRVLGLFGHLKAKKGVPFFIRSIEEAGLADSFHLLLVGELEGPPPTLAHTHLPSLDRFDLLPYYTASDFIVLPSHYDGFPNVLIEAMALARPIIASAVGGMADLLTDRDTAFLFPPGDEHGCHDAIARAAASPDSALCLMGERGRAWVRERCDAGEETRRYLEVLDFISGDQTSCLDSQSFSAPL